MPDLELLRDCDIAEWESALTEFRLVCTANAAVSLVIGGRFPGHVEEVAQEALLELMRTGIQRCYSVGRFVPMLRKISRDRAVDFLRSRWVRYETTIEEFPEMASPDAGEGHEPEWARLTDQLGLAEDTNLADVVALIVNRLELDTLDEAILTEHIVQSMPQTTFAQRHDIPLGTVGRRAAKLKRRLRTMLFGRGVTFIRFLHRGPRRIVI